MSQVPSKFPPRAFETPFVERNGMVSKFWAKQLSVLAQPAQVPQFLIGTHAQRLKLPAGNYAAGTQFQESDRLVTYVVSAMQWVYQGGVMQTVQTALPADLGLNDIGFLAEVNDYAHLLQWTGSGWAWGPGDAGSGYYAGFQVTPSSGWHAADGSTNVPYLQSNGLLGLANVSNTAGSYFRQ